MVKLSTWEELVITMGISFLTLLRSKIKNTVELAALDSAVEFLQKLVAGTVPTA